MNTRKLTTYWFLLWIKIYLTVGQFTKAALGFSIVALWAVVKLEILAKSALSTTCTSHNGEYEANAGEVPNTLCVWSVPGSVLNPEAGPVVLSLNITKLGDIGTSPVAVAVNAFSSKLK